MAAVNNSTTQNALIKDQVSSMLIKPLEAASVVLNAGPTIFQSSEPLRVPRLGSSGDAGWVGEGELIPDTYTMAHSEIALMPKDRKSIKVICRFTNELVRMASQGVSSVMQQRLVEDVRTLLDDALLKGDGSNNTVTGILNQPGTQKGVLDLTTPDTFLDGLAMASAKEINPNRWFINGQDFFKIRKLKDQNGKYILESDITADTTYRLFGVPVTVSNKMPAGKVALLDMKEVAVVRDIDPTITILNERYAEYDETGIRVVTRYDLGLLRPEGVVILEAAA